MNKYFNSLSFKIFIIVTFLSIFFNGCRLDEGSDDDNVNSPGTIKNWAYQLQNADPTEISNSGFELIVIDYSLNGEESGEYSNVQVSEIKNSDKLPIAYLSIGEAEDYRFYWEAKWKTDPPVWLGRENPEWKGNYKVKFWEKEWKDIVFSYMDRIIANGFSGVYLDIVDAFEYWSDDEIDKDLTLTETDAAERMIDFIKEISDYGRSKAGEDFMVIPQNGERIIDFDKNDLYINSITGIGIEDLFYNETSAVKESETEYRINFIYKIIKRGKIVFSIDYVDNGSGYSGNNKKRIDDYYEKCKKRGYFPYAGLSDRELDELNVINDIQPK